MLEPIRRVVTGEPSPRESVFTHVDTVEPLETGQSAVYGIWGWDEPVTFPCHETGPYAMRSIFPPPHGARVAMIVFPPQGWRPSEEELDDPVYKAAVAQQQALWHAEGKAWESPERKPGVPGGLHRTDSIDIGYVVSGRLGVSCSDGVEQILEPGDVYIQNGASHSWRGLAATQSMLFVVVLPGERVRD